MWAPCKLRRWLSTSQTNDSGVAAVEFALAVPIMLILYLGSVEGSTLIILDRKIQTASSALGDIVSRTDGILTQDLLGDYFQAASGIMHPYSVAPVVQTVSGVEVTESGETIVRWSRQYGDGKFNPAGAYAEGTALAMPKEMSDLASGRIVIVAEASYEYAPNFALGIDQTVLLHRTSYHMPRTTKGVSVQP